jgi:hypothetical protein
MWRWAQKNQVLAAAIITAAVTLLVTFSQHYRPEVAPVASPPPAATPKPATAVPQDKAPRFSPPVYLLDWTPSSRGETARVELRRYFRLRALLPVENGLRFSTAPKSVYGYADPTQVMYSINAPHLPLEEFRFSSGKLNPSRDVEVHKLDDGSLRLIGFIPSEGASRVAWPSENISFTLYNVAGTRADYLISLPMRTIRKVHDLRMIPVGSKKDGALALDLELKLD